jgi:hypothetical protein
MVAGLGRLVHPNWDQFFGGGGGGINGCLGTLISLYCSNWQDAAR